MSPEESPRSKGLAAVLCAQCGARSEELGTLCSACLQRRWWDEALKQQAGLLSADLILEVRRSKGKRKHIALSIYPHLAFCGERLPRTQQLPPVRLKARAMTLDVCLECRTQLETLSQRGKEQTACRS